MRTNQQVSKELRIYFWHLTELDSVQIASSTVLGRLITGDMGGTLPGSSVPQGIQMTDTEYLRCINRIDLALVSLKSYDNQHKTKLWEFVIVKYGNNLTGEELKDHFCICKSTCAVWRNSALEHISANIS